MRDLYLYQNGTRGDVVLARTLFRAALASPEFQVTIGVCLGDDELVRDLERAGCDVVVSDYRNTPQGAPLDLEALCPPGATAIVAWLGGRDDLPTRQWPDVVDAFHLRLRRAGITTAIADPKGEVPMPDLVAAATGRPAAPLRPAVYLDCARTTESRCRFVYDLPRLARALPQLDLLCTTGAASVADNVRDISGLSWPERSALSEHCVALVGTTPDPFALTLTTGNRWKPKALCGYDARQTPPLWNYPGNGMELLATMDELVDFLLAHAAEVHA